MAAIRLLAKINPEWPSESLEIKIADSESELADAYRLLHDSYVNAGFMSPQPCGMRVLPQHLLPQTTTIVAKWDGQVIGTLSLIRDNAFGLPMEKIFGLEQRRAGSRRLAEVSSLAIDPKYRGQANQALFPLFRFVYQYAKHYFGTHEFVIAVNPSTVDMYLGFMCFEKLPAPTKSYDFVKGAPAVGLYLNFETCEDRWRKKFGARKTSSNFHKYWTEIPIDENNRLPKRAYHTSSDPILTPKLLSEFFLDKAQLARKLTFTEIQVLMTVYPFLDYHKVLLPLNEILLRKNARMETQMKAEFGDTKIPVSVWNVSSDGILLRATAPGIQLNEKSHINVWINNLEMTRLEVEVKWCSQKNLFGLQIIAANEKWSQMIQIIESEFKKPMNKNLRIAS